MAHLSDQNFSGESRWASRPTSHTSHPYGFENRFSILPMTSYRYVPLGTTR